MPSIAQTKIKSQKMEFIEFISNYKQNFDELSEVIKPELLPIIEELGGIDLT